MIDTLATNSCHSQQPLIVYRASKMQPMVAIKLADRLHAACAAAGIPDRGRAPALQRKLKARGHDVTVQGVRKWLDGDSIPKSEHLAELAVILDVPTDTLLTGRDNLTKHQGNVHPISLPPDPLLAELLALAARMNPTGLARLVERAAMLAEQHPKAQANRAS